MLRAGYKYDQVEQKLARDDWLPERSMRENWAFRWRRTDDRFHVVFAAFCQRWNLYGMQRDRPLLLKLTANLTPFGGR